MLLFKLQLLVHGEFGAWKWWTVFAIIFFFYCWKKREQISLIFLSLQVEPDFKIVLSIGGANTAGTNRILVTLPACVLTIPAINTEQVVSSTINFTAQGYSSSAFAIDQNNEATVTYYAAKT